MEEKNDGFDRASMSTTDWDASYQDHLLYSFDAKNLKTRFVPSNTTTLSICLDLQQKANKAVEKSVNIIGSY